MIRFILFAIILLSTRLTALPSDRPTRIDDIEDVDDGIATPDSKVEQPHASTYTLKERLLILELRTDISALKKRLQE